MSDHRHPDDTALAEYRAGLIGGLRGRRLAAHVAGCARCASVSGELAAVSAMLASVPAPPLPESVEHRITAALAAEAATARPATETTATTEPGAEAATAGTAGTAAPPGSAWRRRLPRPVVLVSTAAACLVIAGLALFLVRLSPGPASSSAASGAAGRAAGSAASSPQAGSAARQPAVAEPDRAVFLVISSGTRYEPATLAAQVRAELGTSAAAGAVPSAALTGCVLHVTGHVVPSLVDSATYQGAAAYIIAVPGRAWVVGPDCTASDPHLIASVGL